MQLVVDEVITETLEADNVTLQNLNASKHVQVGLCYLGKPIATSLQTPILRPQGASAEAS